MDEWEKLLKTPLREKKPTLRRWTDPTNHVAYNKKCVPGENYGILTGRPNNLFVIDLDVYKTGESSDGIKYDLEYFKKICGGRCLRSTHGKWGVPLILCIRGQT